MSALGDRALAHPVVGRAALAPVLRWGEHRYRRDGTTPRPAYIAMRRLHGAAPSVLADLERRVATTADPGPADLAAPGLAAGEVADVVAALDRDGYARLADRLAPEHCDALEAAARTAVTRAVGGPHPVPAGPVDLAAPRAPRYDLDEDDVLDVAEAQAIVADPSLLAVARRYLRAEPVQDLVTMWWTTALDGGDTDAAAQMFHFDMDRLRFLKVFVYLTDVDDDSGPHVYVRGSHRPAGVPAALRRDGRHPDAAVEAAFGPDVHRITGPRGTVFLADTRGLHKGESVRRGHRLVLQTEYATSLFGAPYTTPSVTAPGPALRSAVAAHPGTFARLALTPG